MLSIIVPVFNGEGYILRCLESLTHQTLNDIEIIFVNDGSTDKTEEILRNYINSSSLNIKLINQSNRGLGAARNTGIKHASGEYITFLDSDDFIDKDMYSTMYNIMIKEECDICICNKYRFNEKNGIRKSLKNIKKSEIVSSDEALKKFIDGEIRGHAWDKIYKTELFKVNNILYEEGKYYEDNNSTISLLKHSKKVFLIDKCLYYYVVRNGSITSGFNEKKVLDFFYMMKSSNKNIKESDICMNYKKKFEKETYMRMMIILMRYGIYHNSFKEIIEYIENGNIGIREMFIRKESLLAYIYYKIIIRLKVKLNNR